MSRNKTNQMSKNQMKEDITRKGKQNLKQYMLATSVTILHQNAFSEEHKVSVTLRENGQPQKWQLIPSVPPSFSVPIQLLHLTIRRSQLWRKVRYWVTRKIWNSELKIERINRFGNRAVHRISLHARMHALPFLQLRDST